MRWLVCIAFAAVLTLAVLQYSFRHGRLITLPGYDDIGYFADSAGRVEKCYELGWKGLWQEYMWHPPHSPYSSTMGTAAFLLFGFHDWAPYAMNSVLALGYFLAADRWLRGASMGVKICCLALVAMLPFVGMSVHEFRPDAAVALLTAVGAFLILSGPFVYGPRRRQLAAGAWLGLAMLAKPPVFPQTLVLGFSALGLATIIDWISTPRRPHVYAAILATLLAWVTVLVPFLLIPAPHYYHDHAHIFSYIHDILFGSFQKSYAFTGTRSEHLLYYLTGHGGQIMLGNELWVLLGVIVVGSAMILITGPRRQALRIAAMIALLCVAWAIPTWNQTKQEFFGLAFDTLLAFTALFVIGTRLRAERVRRDPLPYRFAAVAAVLFASVVYAQWPVRAGNVGQGWENQRRLIVENIFDTIMTHCTFHHDDTAPLPDTSIDEDRKVNAAQPTVVFCGIGDFNPDYFNYNAIKRQQPVRAIFKAASTDSRDYVSDFHDADFIFCAEPGTLLIADNLPVAPLLQPLLDEAKSRTEFAPAGKWTFMKSTHSLYLFQRVDFKGFEIAGGMGAVEGPYPQLNYALVRWGLGPSTQLKVPVDRDGAYEVYWDAFSGFKDQVVTVKLDGRAIGTQNVKFSQSFKFGENRFPIAMTAGTHELEFVYSQWPKDVTPANAVLFHHLNIARKN